MFQSKLITSTVLLCCMAQVNANMMQYNTSNQMIRVDRQSMTYSPKGYLAAVDNVNILHVGSGAIIEQQGSMVATTFGGVRLLSNGIEQTIFTDNHNTLKTTSSDKNQRSYTDPYGSSIQKVTKESYPLENNRLTFGGGYKINKNLTNFNARNYILSLKVFSSMDSSDVANRYNFSDGNPIMKFDPSGHNAQDRFNNIGGIVAIFFAFFSLGTSLPVYSGLASIISVVSLGTSSSGLITNEIALSYEDYNSNPYNKDKISKKKIKDIKLASTILNIVSLVLDISSFSVSGRKAYKDKGELEYTVNNSGRETIINTVDEEILNQDKAKHAKHMTNMKILDENNKKFLKNLLENDDQINDLMDNSIKNLKKNLKNNLNKKAMQIQKEYMKIPDDNLKYLQNIKKIEEKTPSIKKTSFNKEVHNIKD